MYFDSLSFLEDERDAWRPYEALLDLSDDDLERKVEGAHGWSGRDLMGHLTVVLEGALAVARELAVGEASASKVRLDAAWDAEGEAINDRFVREWAALPLAEVRARFHDAPGELRGTLTVVPEARWLKHPRNMEFLASESIDHYADHAEDLAAILVATS